MHSQLDSLRKRDCVVRFASLRQYTFAIVSLFLILPTLEAQQPPSGREMVDALHSAFGEHHARAVHAKGEIVTGTFVPSGEGSKYTIAPHLQKSAGTLKVIARFSDFTGIPDISDVDPNGRPKGFALRFILPDGQVTDIVCHSFNGFPTSDSADFAVLLRAIGTAHGTPPDTKPLDDFLASHPVAKTFLTTQKPTPVSWGTTMYFGVNAFSFTNKAGEQRFIRYRFVPIAGEAYLSTEQEKSATADYLMEELPHRLANGPVRFRMQAQLAETADAIEDPSKPWPENRNFIELGIITLSAMVTGEEDDKNLQFEPGSVTRGIAIADPMLLVRRQAYPVSVSERQ